MHFEIQIGRILEEYKLISLSLFLRIFLPLFLSLPPLIRLFSSVFQPISIFHHHHPPQSTRGFLLYQNQAFSACSIADQMQRIDEFM